MTQPDSPITPYASVNEMLAILIQNMKAVLGDQIVAMYLDGSLANGDFDQDSDIDFMVVTKGEISEETFQALRAMHDRLQQVDSIWADQLEGSYFSLRGVRRYDPNSALYPNMERGKGERLKLVRHNEVWDVHRHVLLQRGITILGPEPRELIDPLPPERLTQAMRVLLDGWAAGLLERADWQNQRGYQSYIVLSLCRILYTLEHGEIVSKKVAATWAMETLDPRWRPLIESAWVGRHQSSGPALAEDVEGTREWIRYVLKSAKD